MPFGLTNGPAIYQQYINNILFNYLNYFCTVYINNILIYSKDFQKYKEYIKKVLARLQQARLQTDIVKSEFSIIEIKYLGFIIFTNGI